MDRTGKRPPWWDALHEILHVHQTWPDKGSLSYVLLEAVSNAFLCWTRGEPGVETLEEALDFVATWIRDDAEQMETFADKITKESN